MCQYDVIPILVHLLRDKDTEVQANAAGALMYTVVTTEGEAEVAVRGVSLRPGRSRQGGGDLGISLSIAPRPGLASEVL